MVIRFDIDVETIKLELAQLLSIKIKVPNQTLKISEGEFINICLNNLRVEII